ncbi:D-glycerate 2-kinase, partial [hydrothermal vent metagenome]
ALLQKIHLHAARPAGFNEPTEEGVQGTDQIFEMVSQLEEDDLCIVLLSGGGSALLPAPVKEISLNDKRDVTQQLMQAGATINELNIVRKQLSRIKGGGLAKAARNTQLVALIISDVINDPLDIIASGPTVVDTSTPQEALDILKKFSTTRQFPQRVLKYLEQKTAMPVEEQQSFAHVTNHIIGNNKVALQAAKMKAEELGFQVIDLGSHNGGVASDVGVALAKQAMQIRDESQELTMPVCLLSGGEPVVHLTKTEKLRKGGRNQELVLAGLQYFWDDGMSRVVLLSGGTDGEDGPTNAAGAMADAFVINDAHANHMTPAGYLAINNSYPFFETLEALLKTGPTHTNVMDLRVVLVDTA